MPFSMFSVINLDYFTFKIRLFYYSHLPCMWSSQLWASEAMANPIRSAFNVKYHTCALGPRLNHACALS